jgi:hypothetical protein
LVGVARREHVLDEEQEEVELGGFIYLSGRVSLTFR